MKRKIKVVIIGGGATGMGVASKLLLSKNNDKSFDIHVYQQQSYISLGACSIPYFIANDFKDTNLLTARTKQDFTKKNKEDNKIKIHLNQYVTKIDENKQEIYVETITKDKTTTNIVSYHILVIATGATPRILKFFRSDKDKLLQNVYSVTTKEDAINIKNALKTAQKVVIVGGGFIGMEMAEACLKQKKDVTIVEIKKHLMSDVVDKEFSDLIYNEITGNNNNQSKSKKEQKNAKVLLNHEIYELMATGNDFVKHLRVKEQKEKGLTLTLPCDIIILATGFIPNTSFLQNSKIKLNNNNAIVINEFCQVTTKNITEQFSNIYSGGDCTQIYSQYDNSPQYIPLATNANKMARIIANNIINPIHKYEGTLGSSIVRIGNLEIARTGTLKNNNDKITSVYIEDTDLPSYLPQAKPLYLKLFYDKTTFKLIAAQLAGYNHATLRINALATAIWNKMDVRQLQNLDLAYSPPFARTNDIIHIASRHVK